VSQPAQSTRPMAATRPAGLFEGLPPGDTVWIRNTRWKWAHTTCSAMGCGGGRLRARQRGYGDLPILPFAGALRARAARRRKRQRARPLRGERLQGWHETRVRVSAHRYCQVDRRIWHGVLRAWTAAEPLDASAKCRGERREEGLGKCGGMLAAANGTAGAWQVDGATSPAARLTQTTCGR